MLSKKDIRVLTAMGAKRLREDEIDHTSYDYLHRMFIRGLITGAGNKDDKGVGNYKWSRYWWATSLGIAELERSK